MQAATEGLSFNSLHPRDMTQPAQVQRLFAHVAHRHGGLGILVNAAAAR